MKYSLDNLGTAAIITFIMFFVVCFVLYLVLVWIAVGYLIMIVLPSAVGNIWIHALFWIIITSFITALGKIGTKN